MKSFVRQRVENLGEKTTKQLEGLGSFFSFLGEFFYWCPKKPIRTRLFFKQFYFVGNRSLFIIGLSSIFTGMVMTYQTYFGFKLINVDSLVGPAVALTLAKELAPVLTGLIVAGRAGAAMAAEIGSMKISEQVDALEVMGISSHQYLAVPRIVAATLTVPLLSIFFLFLGCVGSYVVGTTALGIDSGIFYNKLDAFVFPRDIWEGVIKAAFFGFTIGAIGAYFGFKKKSGAEDVGRATNEAVVWGMMMVVVMDYFLTSFLLIIL